MSGSDLSVDLVFEDSTLLVLNKPGGLLSVPGKGADKQDCLSARVQRIYPEGLIVHRLDMATSGLLLMARSVAMQRSLGMAFASRAVQKRYVAVVAGRVQDTPSQALKQEWQLIDLPIAPDWPNRPVQQIDLEHGKPSQTRYRVLSYDTAADTTRLELAPLTGRTHQLRVHLQALGHPILGDALYASEAVAATSNRLLLHASVLTFIHPVTHEAMAMSSEVPF
ncbi:MAG: RluA family pseudouridine synthase [Actinomycetota bacterium]|nr:RluA family pseudouridine synthase [Actinomycetota bacterium]